jgi:drug/metabolite transporter (DMT)-like permease
MSTRSTAYTAAFFAILLWASLASFATYITHIPAFFLTGISLVIGSLISIHKIKHWNFDLKNISFGVYGIAGFHIFYFLGLRHAPAIETNLINYLWPLLIILFSPFLLKKPLTKYQLVGAALGFLGALLAIASRGFSESSTFQIGYLFSFFSAMIWATFSLGLSKSVSSVWQTGLYCLASGLICLLISLLTHEHHTLSQQDWIFILVIGLGPLGASFYLWDFAIKKIGPILVAPISYFTPVISTALLTLTLKRIPNSILIFALILVLSGVIIGNKKSRQI